MYTDVHIIKENTVERPISKAQRALSLLTNYLRLGNPIIHDNNFIIHQPEEIFKSGGEIIEGYAVRKKAHVHANASDHTRLHEKIHTEVAARRGGTGRGYAMGPPIGKELFIGLNEGMTEWATILALQLDHTDKPVYDYYQRAYIPILDTICKQIARHKNLPSDAVRDEALRGYFNSNMHYLMDNTYTLWGEKGIQMLALLGVQSKKDAPVGIAWERKEELTRVTLISKFFNGNGTTFDEQSIFDTLTDKEVADSKRMTHHIVKELQLSHEEKESKKLLRKSRRINAAQDVGALLLLTAPITLFVAHPIGVGQLAVGGTLLGIGSRPNPLPYHDHFIDPKPAQKR